LAESTTQKQFRNHHKAKFISTIRQSNSAFMFAPVDATPIRPCTSTTLWLFLLLVELQPKRTVLPSNWPPSDQDARLLSIPASPTR
jgi:hypothetical protein